MSWLTLIDKVIKCQSFHRNAPAQFHTTSRPYNDKRISPTNIKMMGTRKQITTIPSSIKLYTQINPYLTNGFSHHYYLEESTFIFRGVRSDFHFLSHFSMKFLCANKIAPRWDAAFCGVISGAMPFAYVP